VEAMKAHPQQARLHVECFKCLRDLDHDTKIAISHAGLCQNLNLCHSFEFIQKEKEGGEERERDRMHGRACARRESDV
jgi:hypothetical protein